MVKKIVTLAAAGALGTLSRYGLALFTEKMHGFTSLLGNLIVNSVGCFAAGLVLSLSENRLHLSPSTRLFVFVGFMGAFTTFSAIIMETGKMVQSSDLSGAAGHLLLHNGLGLLALFAGMILGRSL